MMLLKRTGNLVSLLVLLAGMMVVGLTHSAPVAGQDDADTKAKIEDAMSAGLPALAKEATILDTELDDDGTFVVLREGTNGWYCQADSPATPGPDPICFDETWLEWVNAFVAGKEPDTKVAGLAYMLQGGSDASNTDPFATEPAAGEEWMTAPPHVMLLLPGDLTEAGFTSDYTTGGPWVMWAGTPYEHIMMPVTEGEPVK